jgi:RHS repeat-associated protein
MIVESSDLDPEAPSKAYYVADGVIYAENANLGSEKSRRDYAVDFLGSVTGHTAGSDASLSSVRRWSAYGKLLSGSAEPIGYFWTGNTGSRVYQSLGLNDNRARHYGRNIKQWITRDPLWPSELPYAYASGNPVTRIDPSGAAAQFPPPPPASTRPGPPIPSFGNPAKNKRGYCTNFENYVSIYCAWCKRNPSNSCKWECNRLAERYKKDCNKLQLTPGQYAPGWDVRVPIPPGTWCPPKDPVKQPPPYFGGYGSVRLEGDMPPCGDGCENAESCAACCVRKCPYTSQGGRDQIACINFCQFRIGQ